MIARFLLLLLCACSLLQAEEEYQFYGRHFIASYLDCDEEAIKDVLALRKAMDDAVLSSNATLLDSSEFVFAPNGLTVIYLLSESHASIHTYPEKNACFVDLFTCGDKCSAENFDRVLRDYLKPKKVNARLLLRHEEIEEIEEMPWHKAE